MSPLIALIIHTFASTQGHAPACASHAPLHDVRSAATLSELEARVAHDGVRCVDDTWVLAKVYLAHDRPESLTRAIVAGLEARDAELGARLANLVRVIGVAEPEAFATIVMRFDLGARGLARLAHELEQMPAGPKRDALSALLVRRAP